LVVLYTFCGNFPFAVGYHFQGCLLFTKWFCWSRETHDRESIREKNKIRERNYRKHGANRAIDR